MKFSNRYDEIKKFSTNFPKWTVCDGKVNTYIHTIHVKFLKFPSFRLKPDLTVQQKKSGLFEDFPWSFLRTFSGLFNDFLRKFSGLSQDFFRTFRVGHYLPWHCWWYSWHIKVLSAASDRAPPSHLELDNTPLPTFFRYTSVVLMKTGDFLLIWNCIWKCRVFLKMSSFSWLETQSQDSKSLITYTKKTLCLTREYFAIFIWLYQNSKQWLKYRIKEHQCRVTLID